MKSESFERGFESFSNLSRQIFSYVMTSRIATKKKVVLTGNFLQGGAAKRHLLFPKRNTYMGPPYLQRSSKEYWTQLKNKFLDVMLQMNPRTEMF
jgi:hypothetical protein